MEEFYPQQRWESESEPELGIGIVTETAAGRVRIDFPSAQEDRLYATASAPLRRVRFKPGDRIVNKEGESLVVEKVELNGHHFEYYGGGIILPESELGNVASGHGPDDRLMSGDVDSINAFALRRETLELAFYRRRSPVSGFLGGRISLIPHQLYIAHEVSNRYAPRVLLSDEVGLGKTIEACLILHRLMLRGRVSRVLIMVPESLVHQWFVELLRRFNMWFHIFDEERCEALDEGAPEGNPFLDDQLILCSFDFLSGSPKRATQALEAGWDMLVVDEAHHLQWSEEKVSPEYTLVEALGSSTNGMLLLSATPEQLGQKSHFARLRLLDPDRFTDYEAFLKSSTDQRQLAEIVEKISGQEELQPNEKSKINQLFEKDRIGELAKGGQTAQDQLIEDLLDQYGPGRVVFRNTRASLKGFPERKVHLHPIEVEIPSLDTTENTDAQLDEELQIWGKRKRKRKLDFSKDPKFQWLLKHLNSLNSAKVLLICRSKSKVLALEKAIMENSKIKTAVFHEGLTIVQRDRNAAWFAEERGAQILLASEIGSEGRNFQFAHHLVLFDLPLHPEMLEQRIGRLDRIGQTETIHIHVPFMANSSEAVTVKWYHEGLNAFYKNIEGGDEIQSKFGSRLNDLLKKETIEESVKEVADLIKETKDFVLDLRQRLALGRNRLLEMNSYRPKVAEELVEKIRAEDKDKRLEIFMNRVFDYYGVEVEDLGPRTYLLHNRRSKGSFPSIADGGSMVTYERKRAIEREEISFLTWDHPMVLGAIDMVMGTAKGSASFGIIHGAKNPALLLEVLFVIETGGVGSPEVDRYLESNLIRVMVNHSGEEVSAAYPVAELNSKIRSGQVENLIRNEEVTKTLLPDMILAATQIAETIAKEKITLGLDRLNQKMDHEIDRLIRLRQKNKSIRLSEIKMAMKSRQFITSKIEDAQIRMDAIQFIQQES